MLPPSVVSGLRQVRKVSNKSGFGNRHFTAAVGPQSIEATYSNAAARTLRLGPIIKRVLDLLVAAVGLISFSPILLLTALAIILDSKGPVVCRQVRYGYGNQNFRVFAFRCTTHEKIGGSIHPRRSGERVTTIGRILRSSGIDRLPQLINVLRGEISIVGPRPYETPPGMTFDAQLSRFAEYPKVKPGLTGWGQINGCGDASSLTAMRRRIEYDLYYAENWSFLLDLKIILMTMRSKNTYLRAD